MGHPGDRERNITKTEEQVVIHKLNYRRYDGLEFIPVITLMMQNIARLK